MDSRIPPPVLILDGRDAIRASCAEALNQAGLSAVAVAHSQAALDTIDTDRPRVIVASLDESTRHERMTFCRTLKDDARTRDIPIVLMTFETSKNDVDLSTDPGVLVLTIMPGDWTKLVGAVRGVLAAQRAEPLKAGTTMRKNASRSA